MPFDLTGKIIVVTGASSGIGRQCAITCSNMGASVALLGRDEGRLQKTRDMMNVPERHTCIESDFLESSDYGEIVKGIVNSMGRISGVIHSAGISTTLPLRMLSAKKIETFSKVNVQAPLMLTKAVVKPAFISPDGASIVFMSSVMGVVGEVGKTVYSMSKGALIAAARSLALELAPKKIRVNCISPGVVETPMSHNAVYSQSEEALDKIRNSHPLGLGSVDDVASACIFLLSDEARWITGTNLIVDGGYAAR